MFVLYRHEFGVGTADNSLCLVKTLRVSWERWYSPNHNTQARAQTHTPPAASRL